MRIPVRRTAAAEPLLPPDLDSQVIAEAEQAVTIGKKDPVFRLQKMERALVRAHLAHPEVLTAEELRRLRYLLSFARLTVFEPGAAGGGRGRGDVDVTDEVAAWRSRVVKRFTTPLRREGDTVRRLELAREALLELADEQDTIRRALLDAHLDDFSEADLDAEVGLRALVVVAGGGGGAGYVYIGAFKELIEQGMTPDYVMGGSMGAILGGIFCRELPVPIDDYIAFAHSLSYRGILGPEPRPRRHGIVSLFGLRYDAFAADLFRRPDGEQMRMEDLAIPFDCVVSGIHEQLFSRLPARFRREELARVTLRDLPFRPIGLGPAVVSRLWQVASFMDSRVVKPLVIGGDDLTRQFDVVDAQSFSAAIPGVLHHEVKTERMRLLVDQWMKEKKVAALVDGVAASNVPVELAWRRLRDGRIGTRNGVVLALDSMHPQWDPKHLWLTPITRAVQVQMVRNAPYADHLIRMEPTLSVTTLAPSRKGMDQAIGWGAASIREALPLLRAMTEPVWWDGDTPSYADRPAAPQRASVAPAMAPIVAASRRGREWWRQVRDRYWT